MALMKQLVLGRDVRDPIISVVIDNTVVTPGKTAGHVPKMAATGASSVTWQRVSTQGPARQGQNSEMEHISFRKTCDLVDLG